MNYQTLSGHCLVENVIKKSKFIGNCYHVEDEKEAEEYIKLIQKEHYKATHNTFAYVLGIDKGVQKYSDDGEPSGTAGKPILEAIFQNNMTNILIVVTRYFGGIKLGAGGLIRAYSGTATLGIKGAKHISMQFSSLLQIACEYTNLGKIKAFLDSVHLKEDSITYDEKVRIRVYIPIEETEIFMKKIIENTNNQVDLTVLREEYIEVDREG